MSELLGLSVVSRDPDAILEATEKQTIQFINISNKVSSESIFIAGTATEPATMTNIAHGKFSKLSLVSLSSSGNVNPVEDSIDSNGIIKGYEYYLYVDNDGQLKTKKFEDLFEDKQIMRNIRLKDNNEAPVTLSGEELKKLKELITP